MLAVTAQRIRQRKIASLSLSSRTTLLRQWKNPFLGIRFHRHVAPLRCSHSYASISMFASSSFQCASSLRQNYMAKISTSRLFTMNNPDALSSWYPRWQCSMLRSIAEKKPNSLKSTFPLIWKVSKFRRPHLT